MDDESFHLIGIITGFVFLVIMFVAGVSIGANAMRQEALRRGFAQYSQKTGEWQWRESRTETENAGEP